MEALKNLFIPYRLAVLAKEKGFNESCMTTYMPSPLPPYKWSLQSIHGIILYSKQQQSDSHKLDFTGYLNSVPAHFGLKSVSAPLYQQIVEWLRDKHDILISVAPYTSEEHMFDAVIIQKYSNVSGYRNKIQTSPNQVWHNYYEAFNYAIEESFKLI